MNKESSVKQLKRIKQDMTHADDVNALGYAIRFMENKTLEKISAEIESLSNANPSYWYSGDMVEREEVLEIIDKYKEDT